jgi:hypothetical protein
MFWMDKKEAAWETTAGQNEVKHADWAANIT